MSGLRVIAAPSGEQITLAEARLHLRLDDDSDSPPAHPDDPWLSGVGIPAAREYCEGWLGRALAPVTLELALDSFTSAVEVNWGNCCLRWSSDVMSHGFPLPLPPIVSVQSVRYYDVDGILQTLPTSAYHVDDYGGRIVLASGASWPATSSRPNAVLVRYQAGYSLAGDSPNPYPLPFSLKAAMLLVLAALYENREDEAEKAVYEMPIGAKSLMMPYRIRLAMA